MSPLFIACYRRHLQLAKTICDIAQAQYQPPDRTGIYERYNMTSPESDEESDSEDGIAVYKELVDENFTIENVAAVSSTTKSGVTPLVMLGWPGCGVEMPSDWEGEFSGERHVSFLPLSDEPRIKRGALQSPGWNPPSVHFFK